MKEYRKSAIVIQSASIVLGCLLGSLPTMAASDTTPGVIETVEIETTEIEESIAESPAIEKAESVLVEDGDGIQPDPDSVSSVAKAEAVEAMEMVGDEQNPSTADEEPGDSSEQSFEHTAVPMPSEPKIEMPNDEKAMDMEENVSVESSTIPMVPNEPEDPDAPVSESEIHEKTGETDKDVVRDEDEGGSVFLPLMISIALALVGVTSLMATVVLIRKKWGETRNNGVFALPPVFAEKETRIAVLGDIHGNVPALEAVLADIREQGISQMVCTGDLVGYGAEPEACARRIAAEKVPVVKGNHDQYAACPDDLPRFNPVAANTIFWTRGRLSHECKNYLRNLPYTLQFDDFQVVHGNLFDPPKFQYVLKREDAEVAFADQVATVCFIGHSHVPAAYCKDGVMAQAIPPEDIRLDVHKKYIVNVGSVGQSRDGNCEACYAIYDRVEKRIVLRRVRYDVAITQARIGQEGLPSKNAERLSTAS